MSRYSLAGRLSVIIILVAVLSASVSGMINLLIARQQFADYIDVSSQGMAEQVSSSVKTYYKQYGTLDGYQQDLAFPHMGAGFGRMNGMHQMMGQGSVRIIVADHQDLVVADSASQYIGQVKKADDLELKGYPVILDSGGEIGKVYISSPLKTGIKSLENTFLSNISKLTLVSILIVSCFALLLGIFLSRGIARPISDLSAGIHRLAKGDFKVRVTPRGDHEIYSLVTDFNLMAQKLEDHEAGKQALVSNIAHELRTPLSILRGQLEAVQTGRLKVTEEISSSLVDEIIRLTRLVSDLESIGLAEDGGLRLNKVKVTVNELQDSLLPLRLAMEEEGLVLVEHYDSAVTQFEADRNRLVQILINLLSNAMRHTEPGGKIELSIAMRPDNILLFCVRDHGTGIQPSDLEHVFERFYRADESRSRQAGGTGLGLAIAKSYVEAHGGQIWAESNPGDGAAFYFTLPA